MDGNINEVFESCAEQISLLQSDNGQVAVEFAKFMLEKDVKKQSDTEWRIVTWHNISGTNTTVNIYTAEELYKLFKESKTIK